MSYGDFLGFFALIAGFCFTVIFCVRLLKLHENKPALPGGITAEKATQYATHNAEIENRLRALETIVTDGAWDTARQIETLREPRAN